MTYKFETPRDKYEALTNAKQFIALESKTPKSEKALTFMFTMRGQLLMAKALYYAIHFMNTVPKPHKEHSDIADLEYIQQDVFNLPPDLWNEIAFEDGFVLMQQIRDGSCVHAVTNCETDPTCQCGAVATSCDDPECECNVPEGGAEQFNC